MKTYILTLLLSSSALSSRGQNVHFSFTDGTQQSYALEEVRKTTFSGDVMNLHLTDGTVYSWNVSTIGHYEYDELTSTGSETESRALTPLRVYPNPTTGSLTVEYALETDEPVSLEVRDLQGRIVRHMVLGTLPAGTHTSRWDGIDKNGHTVTSGNYVCRIITPRVQMSRIFIIQ